MSYATQGSSNKSIYDCCAYSQYLEQNVGPLYHQMYFGAQENCSKCIDKKAWYRQDAEIVDIESDLSNRTRPLTRCDAYKYNPNCTAGPNCVSTFDPNAPKVLSPSLCPIVYNNIPIQTSPGYKIPSTDICRGKNEFTEVDGVNTYEDYMGRTRNTLDDNEQDEDVYMYMNTCSNKPLYQGSAKKVAPYYLNEYNSKSINRNAGKGVPPSRQGLALDQESGQQVRQVGMRSESTRGKSNNKVRKQDVVGHNSEYESEYDSEYESEGEYN
jgi:hypothetical protein